MRQKGYIAVVVLVAVVVALALMVSNSESDKSEEESGGTGYMDVKELERRILGKDWDALDIVDTALRPQDALESLGRLVEHDDAGVREIALNCVAMVSDPKVPEMLAKALGDEDDDIRLFALQSLQTVYDESIVSELISNLGNDDGEIRGGVSLLLGEIGRQEAVEPLEKRLETEKDEGVARNVKLALAKLGNDEMKDYFAKQMDVADSGVRYQGLEDLRYIRDRDLAFRIMPALDDFGQADPVSPPGEPGVSFNRVCDKAVNLIDELCGQPFAFETRETKIYSDEELEQAKSFLSSLEKK